MDDLVALMLTGSIDPHCILICLEESNLEAMMKKNPKIDFKKRVLMRNIGFYIAIITVILNLVYFKFIYNELVTIELVNLILIVSGIFIFIGIGTMSVTWKCPVCEKRLPRKRSKHVDGCCYCGIEFR